MARIEPAPTLAAEEAERLAAIVAHSDDAIITKDHNAVITSWNPAAERLYGYSEREAVGSPIEILVPPHRKGEERRILGRIMAGDRVDHYETERVTKYGRTISVSITVSPLKDVNGRIVGASVIARDTTIRRRLQRTQRFLAQAGAALDRSLDPRETLRSIGRVVVPDLGELCIVDLLEPDGRIAETAAAVARDPGLAEALERLRREHPLDPSGSHPVARVLRTGRSEVLPELTDDVLREIAQGDEHLEFMRELRYSSALVAPLQARGRTLGCLSVLHLGEAEPYGPDDLILVEELGRRAAIALDNSRLYEELARARENDRFLSETSKALSGSLDYEETLRRVAQLAVPQVADWCVVDVVASHGGLERVALTHRDPERVERAQDIERRYSAQTDDSNGVVRVVRTGLSELYREVGDDLLREGTRDEEHFEAIRELGMVSAMVVPMVARERTVGAITLVSSTPGRHFDEMDLTRAEELGRRAGIAVENAWLYSERSRVAQTLQSSLLPRALPHIPGVDLASRFRPAGDGLEVGGDFYDVFPAANGTWMAAVGDVCGKGADAASLTALARHTLRALAEREASPGEVLAQLNRAILGHEEVHDRFLTMCLVAFCPSDEGLTACVAAAGHPPPIRVRADGSAEPIPVPGMLLGLFDEVELEESELDLRPGDSLLMYTDGLTDAGAPNHILGPDDVASCLSAAGARGAQELVSAAERLAQEKSAGPPRDDIAILALRAAGGE